MRRSTKEGLGVGGMVIGILLLNLLWIAAVVFVIAWVIKAVVN